MNDEILKLAKECEVWQDFGGAYESIETFYRAAYNKAIADAAKLCVKEDEDCHEYFGSYCAWQIRKLEMK